VYAAAGNLIRRARSGAGPGFLHVSCHRPAGHFEGDPIVRLLKNPRGQAAKWGPPIVDSVRAQGGGSRSDRTAALTDLTKRGARAARDYTLRSRMDPIRRGRRLLDPASAARIEAMETTEVETAIAVARETVGQRATFGASSGGAR
ncbi:MAG: thiamine pyrophosphate-dependent dehydrogenase E1 component subunit alpha, partial [Acidimicrobiales bacterium]